MGLMWFALLFRNSSLIHSNAFEVLIVIHQLQKLTEAFHKNHYPERAVKEGLAKDLGLSYQKVYIFFPFLKFVQFVA